MFRQLHVDLREHGWDRDPRTPARREPFRLV
jgi:hypothetical protein